jgi:hypothetical protein
MAMTPMPRTVKVTTLGPTSAAYCGGPVGFMGTGLVRMTRILLHHGESVYLSCGALADAFYDVVLEDGIDHNGGDGGKDQAREL